MTLIHLLLARRLANREHEDRKYGWFEAVPAMGLAHRWERFLNARRAARLRNALASDGPAGLDIITSPWRR